MLYDQDVVWTGHPSKSLEYLPLTTGKGSELAVPRLAVYFSFAATLDVQAQFVVLTLSARAGHFQKQKTPPKRGSFNRIIRCGLVRR